MSFSVYDSTLRRWVRDHSRLALVIATVCMLWSSLAAAGRVDEAEGLLAKGRYAAAEKLFRQAAGGGVTGARALIGIGRVLLDTGRYAEAAEVATRGARGSTLAQGLTLAAEARMALGDSAEAERLLKRALRTAKRHFRALLQLGLVYRGQGKKAQARRIFERFYDEYDAGRLDQRSAEQLTYVGLACRFTDNFRDAADVLRLATETDSSSVDAWVQWAELSFEKYDAEAAQEQYRRALALNPRRTDALVGLARLTLDQTYDVDAAIMLVNRALAVNPHHLDALSLTAQLMIDNHEHQRARATLAKGLRHNPNHLGALSVLAASYYLADEMPAYRRTKQRVLALNGRYTGLFRTVVAAAVRQHRYADAVVLGREAIAKNPEDWYSLADLGTNYLRLGQEATGLRYLERAWQGDRYNERTFRLLNLYDDVLKKQYVFKRSRHFRIRVHRAEAALLERVVLPELERAYAYYAKRYGLEPEQPITVELYREPEHYAIRTVGMPRLDVLGVCFGRVITTTSPTLGRFNWAQVLWHELNHAFAIRISRSRVPRWFTEGLADYETAVARPEWRREADFELYKALQAGRAPHIASLHRAFGRARTIGEMVVAYHQSALLVGYLVDGWGVGIVPRVLAQYAKGQRTEDILPRLTGKSLGELEAGFRQSERQRLTARYGRGWYLKNVRRGPQARDAAEALSKLGAGDLKWAARVAHGMLERDAANKVALYVLARVALRRRRSDEAVHRLKKLVGAGGDGYYTRTQLGRLALVRGDMGQGVKHLTRAKQFAPEMVEPYELLARAYGRAGDRPKQLQELKQWSLRAQQKHAPVAALVELLAEGRDYAGLRRFGELAYHIQPASERLHVWLAEAYEAPAPSPYLKRAIWHLETALLCKPPSPKALRRQIARLRKKVGGERRARQ